MASRFATLVAATYIVLHSVTVQAAPEPIVFDFEDGLQGWRLNGVERRTESVLGGSYAMFGQQFDNMWIEIDLTNVERITFDALVTGDIYGFVTLQVREPPAFGGIVLVASAMSLLEPPPEPIPNPDTRWFDVSTVTGLKTVVFRWPILAIAPGVPSPSLKGFIDNITFHPVPEPSTLLLLGSATIGLALIRRRIE